MLEWGETNTTSWLDACCGNHPRPTVQVGQFSYKIGYTLYPPKKKWSFGQFVRWIRGNHGTAQFSVKQSRIVWIWIMEYAPIWCEFKNNTFFKSWIILIIPFFLLFLFGWYPQRAEMPWTPAGIGRQNSRRRRSVCRSRGQRSCAKMIESWKIGDYYNGLYYNSLLLNGLLESIILMVHS